MEFWAEEDWMLQPTLNIQFAKLYIIAQLYSSAGPPHPHFVQYFMLSALIQEGGKLWRAISYNHWKWVSNSRKGETVAQGNTPLSPLSYEAS